MSAKQGLTTAEAASLSGVNRNTLHVAIYQNRLPATKGDGGRWLIDPDDLALFRITHRPLNKRAWTEADLAALAELQDSCTRQQLSAYLGRTVRSVDLKITKLRAAGELGYRKHRTLGVPFHIPSRAILIAKTCAKCGKLRDGSYYRMINRAGTQKPLGYDPFCHLCNVKSGKDKYKQLKERDPNANTNTGTLHRLLQTITADRADRSNIPYTSADMDVIQDASKSTLEVALELGRTFQAIRLQRYVNGVADQRFSDIFIHKKRRKKLSDSHWTVHFPAAAKALREHFIKLGEAVPEELWEWNDTEEMAS